MGEIALRPDTPAVDVHGVVDGLKGVERDTDGQYDLQNGEAGRGTQAAHSFLDRLKEEVGVLEVAEQAEVHDEAAGQQQAARDLGPPGVHAPGNPVVDGCGNADEDRQHPVPAPIKTEAGHQQQPDPGSLPGEHPVEGENGKEEKRKFLRAKQHGISREGVPSFLKRGCIPETGKRSIPVFDGDGARRGGGVSAG